MYLPATPALAGLPPASAGILASASPVPMPPAATVLRVRRIAHRPARRLSAYRLAEVSWYGGGGSLACGGLLTSSTMGVANKTLPCGTRVTLRYHGRTVRVRVIDRGPYVEGREYDLTEATARTLGFEGVGEMWVRVSRTGSARRR
jgi:rare lipoprotein A (peptidoglycan hydrolase)